MLIHLIYAQKNKLRVDGQRLRDTMDPFSIPTERFIERYRLPPSLTIKLIGEISPFLPEDHDQRIPLHLRVLSTLSFYASGCYQRRVGMDAFCMLSQSSISKFVNEISNVIAEHLAPKYIQFPQTKSEVDLIKDRFKDDYNLDGVLGLIDCSQIPIVGMNLDLRNTYINHKGGMSINTQGIIDSDMRFLNVNARYPGSTHDTYIWNNSKIFAQIERQFHLEDQALNIYRDSFLIGDLGYPLQPWLMIPVRKFTENKRQEKMYNKTIRKYRSKNERGFAVLKNRWRCLSGEHKLRYKHDLVGKIIYSCVTLHNFLIDNSFDIEYKIPKQPPLYDEYENDEYNQDLGLDNNYLEQGTMFRNRLIDTFF